MTAIQRLELFLDMALKAVFHVPWVWLSLKIPQWVTDHYFTVKNASETYVTGVGSNVFLLLSVLVVGGWLSAFFERLKQLVRGLDEKEQAEWESDKILHLWEWPPPSMDDGPTYITKRALQFTVSVMLISVIAFANGRVIAWQCGGAFIPSSGELLGIGVVSLAYLASLVARSWNLANQEFKYARASDTISYVIFLKIYSVLPYCILYEVAGAVASSGDQTLRNGGQVLLFGGLAYFVYGRVMAPVTKWLDEVMRLDRLMGSKEQLLPGKQTLGANEITTHKEERVETRPVIDQTDETMDEVPTPKQSKVRRRE